MLPKDVLRTHDKIGDLWSVVDKLGEGGCGVVFLIKNIKDDQHFAMKIEMANIRPVDQLLRNEARILQKLKFSKHVPAFYCYGKTPQFRLLVMDLLGESLNDIRYTMPKRQFSIGSTLRIGLQVLQAIENLHDLYFVHRDIKPANLAFGMYPNNRRLYLFDFGLARSLLHPVKRCCRLLRPRRNNIAFRGTITYCSPNVHKKKEHGRHDDLWSMMYVCIELIIGKLPWNHMHREKAFIFKQFISDKILLQGCPQFFKQILQYIRSLSYHHRPDYNGIRRAFESCLSAQKALPDDPFDWEIIPIAYNFKPNKLSNTAAHSLLYTNTAHSPTLENKTKSKNVKPNASITLAWTNVVSSMNILPSTTQT